MPDADVQPARHVAGRAAHGDEPSQQPAGADRSNRVYALVMIAIIVSATLALGVMALVRL